MSRAAIWIWPLVGGLVGTIATDSGKTPAKSSSVTVGVVQDMETPLTKKETAKQGAASEAPSNGDAFRALHRWISEYWQQTGSQAQRVSHERDHRHPVYRRPPWQQRKPRPTQQESRSIWLKSETRTVLRKIVENPRTKEALTADEVRLLQEVMDRPVETITIRKSPSTPGKQLRKSPSTPGKQNSVIRRTAGIQ